ncbi:MAG: M20/M25/M40 family metallo-hydrolase [bacterium JZ-2024 1]
MLTRDLLHTLISHPSIVGTEEEKNFGLFLHEYTSSLPCWEEVEAWRDGAGRVSVLAFRKGLSSSCVLFLGHYDTVGIEDYPEKGMAFDPERAKKWIISVPDVPPEIRLGLEKNQWSAGRGSLDMKAGIAAQMSFALHHCPSDATVLFLWVPDEEQDSAGARFAYPLLSRFLQKHSLHLKWVIKSDFTHKKGALYTGSTGKCLLNAYIRTKSGHVADGEKMRNALFLSGKLIWHTAQTPPPGLSVTPLHLETFSRGYSVQVPFECWIYLNVLFFRKSLKESVEAWKGVLSRRLGEDILHWVEITRKVSAEGSLREKALFAVQRNCEGEGIHFFFSPPYYPPISTPKHSPVHKILRRVVSRMKKETGIPWRIYPAYPHISDLSFFQHRDENWGYFSRYCPVQWDRVWEGEIPAVSVIGPYGYGAHSAWECVDVEYSLNVLPQLYRHLIEDAQREGFL